MPVLHVRNVLAWPCAEIPGLSDPGAGVEDVHVTFPAPDSRARLCIAMDHTGKLRIGAGSELGQAGRSLRCTAAPVVLSPTGQRFAAVILSDDSTEGLDVLIPAATPQPGAEYRLLGQAAVRDPLASLPGLCFPEGTHITMGNGARTPIDKLRPGARVMTRGGVPRTVIWTGSALETLTPLVIAEGVLRNSRALTVTPDHCLFLPPHRAGQVLAVKARHLVDGDRVTIGPRRAARLIQLLLESHHAMFAEDIAAHSRLLPTPPSASLPEPLLRKLACAPCDGSGPCDCKGSATSDPLCAAALLNHPDAFDIVRRIAAR